MVMRLADPGGHPYADVLPQKTVTRAATGGDIGKRHQRVLEPPAGMLRHLLQRLVAPAPALGQIEWSGRGHSSSASTARMRPISQRITGTAMELPSAR
jgi:hypothetical protein